ncbi:trypsin-like peptidase domain-containing protein [Plebeiibacterium marinum]|uniref:Trypsin-like peptidase domain-containing protein n=1 Tax=Plebeiibacterium marinum TaxID=2992111 RepID=A0AAE3MGV7_9BACT|nr:trypsin-like peptidase domain-containing protein [Plebeiobacterium marinum]MCW3807256.1 trypsin-like peptidase domain-containing protein [Plebeiobacterium marinum]
MSSGQLNDAEVEVKSHHYTGQNLKSCDEYKKGRALQFAHQFTVSYSPDNSGKWFVLEDGSRVWKLRISSPGAYSINLIFDRYVLPDGASLVIYNADQSDMIGAFTSKNNKPSGILATAPVFGDEITVEYREPEYVDFKGELLIGAVNHDFLGVHRYSSLKSGLFGDACDIEVDASCYDADNSLDIRRAVVKLIIDGSYLCSGTLINNTKEDGTPYVITAAHCLQLDQSANSAVVFFNYETPHCGDVIEGSKSQSLSYAETKVYDEAEDIALIDFIDAPPAEYRAYYAGWTLESLPNEPYLCIHHPEGDVKKISRSTSAVKSVSYVESWNSPYAQEPDFHWKVSEWNIGTTEGGSSGSGLFDVNNRLIGTLSGGEAGCEWTYNDYYTKFYKAWDLRSESSKRFKEWLDANNTGAQSLDGYDPYENERFYRLSNVESGEKPAKDNSSGNGYVSGHNSYKIESFAESFTYLESARLHGAYLLPAESKWKSEQTINIVVWEGNYYPEKLIYRKEGIKLDTLRENREIYLEFDSLVNVEGSFFVGYEIDYSGAPIDSFAVYHTQAGTVKNNNTMLVKENDLWKYASQVFDVGEETLWLDVLADMVVWGDTQIVPETDIEISLYPNPVADSKYINIDINNLYIDHYSVVDTNGKTLINEVVKRRLFADLPIDISGLANGLYILDVSLENTHICKKFIKVATQ